MVPDFPGIRTRLVHAIAALPPHTLGLVQLTPQDSVQPSIGTDDVVKTITQRLPTYCIAAPFFLDRGGIGTAEEDEREQVSLGSKHCISNALRGATGEHPHQGRRKTPNSDRLAATAPVDIPESAVPPGSEILYREPGFWERARKYIFAAAAAFRAPPSRIGAMSGTCSAYRARRRASDHGSGSRQTRLRIAGKLGTLAIQIGDLLC